MGAAGRAVGFCGSVVFGVERPSEYTTGTDCKPETLPVSNKWKVQPSVKTEPAANLEPPSFPPDTLNARIGVLARREVEARLLAPLIDTLSARFGRDEVLEVVRETIVGIARQQGRDLSAQVGGDSLPAFADSLRFWTQDGALKIDLLAQDDDRLEFDVTRCRYAEMYRSMGIPELGALFSCNRDAALIEGFNPAVELTRTQTIMHGAATCDFRYRRHAPPATPKEHS
jgi:hypothetical protein